MEKALEEQNFPEVEVLEKRAGQPPMVTGGQLRDYQLTAVNWLIALFENGVNGILADEMGLGKTVTTIGFLAHLWEHLSQGPFIVVAPLSTLANWVKEFRKFTPGIPVLLYHGSPDERNEMRAEFARQMESLHKRMQLQRSGTAYADLPDAQVPVLVTSYGIAMRDRPFLEKFTWKFLIVDEAHRLKNYNCTLLKELKKINTLNRLLLSGTPLQNNLTELWSLLNYSMPEVFGQLEDFQSWFNFEDDLADESEDSNDEHDNADDNKRKQKKKRRKTGFGKSELLQQLHTVLRPFFLRRLKADVALELPQKRELVLYAGMTDVQRQYYDAMLTGNVEKLTESLDPDAHVRVPPMINQFMQLRKVCNHPCLLNDNFDNFYANFLAPEQPKHRSKYARSDVKITDSRMRARSQVDYSEMSERQFLALLAEADRLEALGKAGREAERLANERDEKDVPSHVKRKRTAFSFYLMANHASAHAAVRNELLQERQEQQLDDTATDENIAGKKTSAAAAAAAANNNNNDDDDENELRVSAGSVMRYLAAKWNELSEEQRKPFAAQAEADRLRYEEDLQKAQAETNPTAFIANTSAYLQMLRSSSGKFQLLDKMLPRLIADGHKCLVFSQMTRMLDILEDYLSLSHMSYVRIDGSTPQRERQEHIERFNDDKSLSLFLLSTRAGGLGINLVAADTVILYDSDWNPQGDLQAQDRAHRIGQTRPVAVYRLITGNSCESRMLERATAKLKLESLVIKKGQFKRRSKVTLDNSDIDEILHLEMGDANVGREAPITDKQLDNVLDRKWLMSALDDQSKGFQFVEQIETEF